MLNWVKKGLWLLAIGATFAGVSDFCQKQTKGFAISKIAPSFSSENVEEIDENVLSIFDQPFHYLRKGNSAYVFVSDDDKYVLKFLRRPNLFPPFWTKLKLARLLLPSYCNAIITERERKKELLLTSYQLAAEKLKDQTGIFYSHMNSTSLLKKNITFYDRIKIKHTLPADTIAFVLQKKAIPFCPYFKQLVEENKKEAAQTLLKEFALLLKERASKGIYDNDISPHYNLGIFEDHFMAFDLDGLKPCSIPMNSESFKTHMLKDGRKMIHWLKSVDPDLSVFLQQEILKLSLLS
jgi:hypothetical protein